MVKRRVLAGGIAKESHSFNPIVTGRERFTIVEGQAAIERNRGANSTFGGVIGAAIEAGVDLIVPTLFRAQSGGPVEDRVFEEVSDVLVDAAKSGNFDAIVLPLHGGMLTESLTEPGRCPGWAPACHRWARRSDNGRVRPPCSCHRKYPGCSRGTFRARM